MKPIRNIFQLSDKTLWGKTIFLPPFKAHSSLENEARFVHVMHGSSRLFVPNDQLNIQTKDSFLMKCDNFVNNWFENENGKPNEVLIIHFYPDMLQEVYENKLPDVFSPKKDVIPNPVEKIPDNPMIETFIEGLRFYFEHPSLVTDDLLKLKIKELILILVNSDQSGRIQAMLSDLFQSTEYEFKEIIHSHLFEDLSIEDLAFFAGLSLSSFKRKFKAVFGTSPVKYIKKKRLEKAQQLLRTSTLRISDIAYDCGFNDLGYFSKSFAAAFNCSPSEYRKTQLS